MKRTFRTKSETINKYKNVYMYINKTKKSRKLYEFVD